MIMRNDRTVPALELNWIDARNKKFQTKLEKLDNDLKNYKSNSIKESIRRGQDDLGDHFHKEPHVPDAEVL